MVELAIPRNVFAEALDGFADAGGELIVEMFERDASLAIISASTRMAVLIRASPPLSANKPDRISSRIDCSRGLRVPSARR